MANYLASIFGTEQDKVSSRVPSTAVLMLTLKPGQLLVLLQDRRVPPRRPLFTQTCQALLLSNHPSPEPVSEPRVRPEEQDERFSATESL